MHLILKYIDSGSLRRILVIIMREQTFPKTAQLVNFLQAFKVPPAGPAFPITVVIVTVALLVDPGFSPP